MASAPKMWKISFPPEVDLTLVEPGDRLDQVLERTPEPIEPPDNQDVAVPGIGDGLGKSHALCLGA